MIALQYLLWGLITSILNLARGGSVISKHGAALMLSVLFFLVWIFNGTNIYFGVDVPSFAVAFLFVFFMWAGESFGWGRYIGAMKDPVSKFRDPKEFDEVKFIDALIKPIVPDWTRHSKKEFTLRTRLWGFLGMSLRGVLWLAIPAYIIKSLPLFIVGGLMGVVYYTGSRKWFGYDWTFERSELLFGFLMGLGIYYGVK